MPNTDWGMLFKKENGCEFDVNSKADRAKMDEIKRKGDPVKPKVEPAPVSPALSGLRGRLIDEARKCVGWKEATGNNDGPAIDKILGSVGLKGTRNPYCAAFNYFVYKNAGASNLVPQSAWSPDWVARATWTKAKGGVTPKAGDTFGIYFANKGRVSHTGMIVEWHEKEGYAVTIEGNTSGHDSFGTAADREGSGVFEKKRKISEFHSIRNWID